MRCNELMSRDIVWVAPTATIEEAARIMSFHNLGMLPVCEAGAKAVGVLTDRDVALRVALENRPARGTFVADVMTTPPIFVTPETPVARVEELMVKAGLWRLLVVEDDRLVGVISLADVLNHARRDGAIATARGVLARETPDRKDGVPHPAREPHPEHFHGAREPHRDDAALLDGLRLRDAEAVIRGGLSGMKEFGG